MSLPVIMHINYMEQGQCLDEICRKAVDWGFDGVEFRSRRTGVDETQEEYLDSLSKAVRESGLKYVIFGTIGPEFMTDDKAKRDQELKRLISFFDMASERFKLTVCNTFSGLMLNNDLPYGEYDKQGSHASADDNWKWAAEGFKVLGDYAEKKGFKLAFETHMCYIHDLPESAKKLVDMIDKSSVGVNLDYGNTVYFKNIKIPSIEEAIDTIGDKLFYVHMKNTYGLPDGNRIPCGLGDGTINHRAYIKKLKNIGYKGPIAIEGPRDGDRENFAQQDMAYVKKLLKEIDL